jgi:4-hydroxybenzoate polyprenyltransferase
MSGETTTVYADTDDTLWYSSLAGSLRSHGERISKALVYSTAYLVVISMVETSIVAFALSVPLLPTVPVVGLLTFAVYAGDRIADVDTDELTDPEQSAFVRRHETLLSVLTAAAYGVAISISVTGGPLALVLTLLPGAFWILYASDWLPALSSSFDRLKRVLIVNTTIVALAWAITLTFLPLAFADAAFTSTAAVVFVYFFLDRFINTEIPNVSDMEGDRAIDVSTLPVVLGVRRTRQALYALALLLGAFLALAAAYEFLTVRMTVALLVGMGYTIGVAAFIGRTDDYRPLTVASNSKHLVVFAALLALSTVGI